MNYFPFNYGDWCAATRHLTDAEELLLLHMICVYYRDEQPLPADLAEAGRKVGARTPEKQQLMEQLLNDYFTLADDGWHQKRCDRELAAYRARTEKAQAGAQARWGQPDLVGDLSTDAPGNANEEPGTKNQKPAAARRVNKSKKAQATPATAETAQAVCELLKAVGLHDAQPDDALLHELLAAGVPSTEFVACALRAGHADHPFRYALKAVQGRLTAQTRPRDYRQFDLLTLDGHTVFEVGANLSHARTQEYLREQSLTDDQRAATIAEARRIRQELLLGQKSNKEPAHVHAR